MFEPSKLETRARAIPLAGHSQLRNRFHVASFLPGHIKLFLQFVRLNPDFHEWNLSWLSQNPLDKPVLQRIHIISGGETFFLRRAIVKPPNLEVRLPAVVNPYLCTRSH